MERKQKRGTRGHEWGGEQERTWGVLDAAWRTALMILAEVQLCKDGAAEAGSNSTARRRRRVVVLDMPTAWPPPPQMTIDETRGMRACGV